MPRYRLPDNAASISIDGVFTPAAIDGTFTVAASSRAEAVLLASGAQQQDYPVSSEKAAANQALVSRAWNMSGVMALGSSFVAQPRESAPTLTIGTSALSGSQLITGMTGASPNVLNSKYFGFYGAKQSNFAARAEVVTQNKVVTMTRGSADTLGGPRFYTSFFLTSVASSFDIVRYNDSLGDTSILIDGNLVACIGYLAAISGATGTAQAGGAASITLAAGASATTGYYNQYYARITGGTGTLNEIRQITAYNGSTKVASVASNWTTPPDATTTYSIDNSNVGFSIDSLGGTLKYINVAWPAAAGGNAPVTRRVDIIGSSFYGVQIGQTDTVWPAPPIGPLQLLVVGDSFLDGTAGPIMQPGLAHQIALRLGAQLVNLSSGGTGLYTRGVNRLSILNRIAPPTEAWEFGIALAATPATGGTFTISVTYNGVTSTTSALAYSASAGTIETALNTLTFNGFAASTGSAAVGPTGQGCFCVARGDINTGWIVVANGMVGATLTIDGSSLTGGTISTPTQYLGDVAKNAPVDTTGAALPFLLLVAGSGNDPAAAGYTVGQLQTNAQTLAAAIVARFPTAITIMTGIIANTNSDGTGVITATDVARSAALRAGAALLTPINGIVPYIDTTSEGAGGNWWFTGTGTVGAPTNGKSDIMKSLTASGHPTGLGVSYLAGRLTTRILEILRGQVL